MNQSDNISELAAALAKAQGKLASAKKDSKGHGYNYSDLATVIEAAKEVLPENGLAYSQLVGNSLNDTVSVTTILMHSSGQFISQEASIKVPEMRGVNDAQKAGAALSYLRRYSLQSILGMASEDNDAATEPKQTFSEKKADAAKAPEAKKEEPKKDEAKKEAAPEKPKTSGFKRSTPNVNAEL